MVGFVEAIQLCEDSIEGMQVEHIEIEQLPMLNTDLEHNGTYPPVVEAFRQKIKEADCVLFASPEYNFSLTGTILSLILQLMYFQVCMKIANVLAKFDRYLRLCSTLYREDYPNGKWRKKLLIKIKSFFLYN